MATTPAFHSLTETSLTSHRVHTQLKVDVQLKPEARVTIRGELDLASVDVVREALAEIEPDLYTTVAMDLSGVTFIDLSGLTPIVECKQRLAASDCELVIEATSPAVNRLLQTLDKVGLSVDLTLRV